MTARTYVLGHRNPDTDSIASAIAYAELLRLQGEEGVIPGRLGPLRPETTYLLDRFGLPAPLLVSSVYPRVADVMTTPAVTARLGESLYEVGQKMERLGMHPLPVVDDANRLQGIVEPRDFAIAFFRGIEDVVSDRTPLNLETLTRTLGGRLLVDAPGRPLRDRARVAAMDLQSVREWLEPGILLVVGDRTDVQLAAIDKDVAALVITGDAPVDPTVIQRAIDNRVSVVVVPYHTYRTVQLINLSVPVEYIMRANPPVAAPEDLVEDVRDTLTRVRELPVVDADERVRGVVTRSDLLRTTRPRVVLVDHNERSQSVPGIEIAEIVGIVDHHRVADLQTNVPPLMRVEPLGACSTLIAKLYGEAGVEIPRPIAGLLVGGIVADTLLFRSPTVTPPDRAYAQHLAERVGVDLQELGKAVLEIASDVSGRSAEELVSFDFKEFQVNDVRFGIGVIETTNASALEERKAELMAALNQKRQQGDFWSILLVVTDVFHERTLVLISGHPEAVAEAFHAPLEDGALRLPGVYSRKKLIVPRLSDIRVKE